MKKHRVSFSNMEYPRSIALFLGGCFSFNQKNRMKNIQFFSFGRSYLVNYCLINGRCRSVVAFKMSRFSLHSYFKSRVFSSIKVVGI
jgi:hypothetical protein